MVAAGFLSHYLSGPIPYIRRDKTVNKNVLSASLNNNIKKSFSDVTINWFVWEHNNDSLIISVVL